MSESNLLSAKDIIGNMLDSPGKPRYLIGQIRDAYDNIEKAKKLGYNLNQIADELKNGGIVITANYLATTLLRIKREREKKEILKPTKAELVKLDDRPTAATLREIRDKFNTDEFFDT